VTDPRREARGVTLALDPHPLDYRIREGVQRRVIERRAARREDDQQRLVIHRTGG